MQFMQSDIERASDMLRHSAYTVALTGAGISTPSGIPDFRSPRSGLWSHADPLQVASLWAFAEHPETFYRWFRPLLARLLAAQPNPAHTILAAMEEQNRLHGVLTQNVDSLHQLAGSRRVLELHGHIRSATCLLCGCGVVGSSLWPAILAGAPAPRCPECSGLLKPGTILFGEPLPYELLAQAQAEALRCEVMIVIGTSLTVMPAADLPFLAHRRGAQIISINSTVTEFDNRFDLVIHADVVRVLQDIWHATRHG
jgi:NAD-dependent deacetylase